MDRAKMRRGLVMLTFMVICTHRPATAQEELASEPKSCMKFLSCVKNQKSSCKTECCNSLNFKATALTRCNCWRIAVRTDEQALTAPQNYCAVDPPLCSVPHQIKQLQEVEETSEAVDNKLSGSKQQVEKVATCCAKDKEKIKNCMFNTVSIEQCCPTFNIMLGRNCGCYNYAKDLDNQVLITLESYCDVTNPCKSSSDVGF